MASSDPNRSTRTARLALPLCGLILLVVAAAGFVAFRQGRAKLAADIERRLARELAHTKAAAEKELAAIVEHLESWAKQPVMAHVLDDDEDHEIAELLDVLERDSTWLTELSCATESNVVAASTSVARLGKTLPLRDGTLSRFKSGLRYVFSRASEAVRVTVPVFVEFDQPELVGILQAVIPIDGVWADASTWWSALTTSSGEVIFQRGPEVSARIALSDANTSYGRLGNVVQRVARIEFPEGGMVPQWWGLIAEPVDVLFEPIAVLKSMCMFMTGGTAILIVALVIGFLARQQRLLRRLQDRGGDLERIAQELEGQKQELVSINEALIVAERHAQTAARSKAEFLANMSHEIRTPMTAILGYADVLVDEGDFDNAPPARIEAIRTIKRNGEYLLEIINDILDISKIDAGKLLVERIAFSPRQLMADVESLMRVRADAKGLRLKMERSAPFPATIQNDPTRLKQILVNLIGNAVKFTQTGGIRVVARFLDDEDNPHMQFDIIDTGIGMSPTQATKLFQPFVQADTSTTRNYGGTGLGLTISKRLAELLGGDITILETHPGKGSSFRLTISVGPIEELKMADPSAGATLADAAEATGSPAPVGTIDGHILLAEDGPDNQKLISFVLRKAGATVTIAENGQLALNAALSASEQGQPFHVILMDMQMPVMDGYEATRHLRRKGYTGPIIALTAHAMAGDRQKCIDAGCDSYATKPISRVELIETIRAHLPSVVSA